MVLAFGPLVLVLVPVLVDVVVVPVETEPGATDAIHSRSVVSAMRP